MADASAAGIAEPFVAFDTETYYDSDYSLSKVSTFEYVDSPKFDCYLISVYTPTFEWVGHPRKFNWDLLQGKTLLAHNAMFDSSVFDRMRQIGIVPQSLRIKGFLDTADMTAYFLCRRSLDSAVRNLLGTQISKAMRAKMLGRTFESLTTEDRENMLKYAADDAKWCYRLFQEFGHKWPDAEKRISEKSREAGKRGMRVNVPLLETSLSSIKTQLFELERDIPWDFRDSGYKTPLAPTQLRAACLAADIPYPSSTAKDSEDFEKWMTEFGSKTSWGPLIGKWRSMNTMLAKLETIERTLRPGGIYPFALKYFGGHTGRWSGDEGFNMQNMYKLPIFGIDLRAHFLPDNDDEVLLVADYSAIEPRTLWWQVGETRMLKLLEQGWNAYHAHAVATMGWPEALNLKALYEEHDPRAADVYPLAKARTLGLGYGCGADKFVTLAAMYGITLTPELSQRAVWDYRDANPRIVAYWRRWQNMAMIAAQEKHERLTINMPSGRPMIYFDPQLINTKREDGTVRQEVAARDWLGDGFRKLYGGKITENLTQALARDILADGWTRMLDSGIDLVKFTSHDEFVMSAPRSEAKNLQRELGAKLATSPDWAPDMPLECKPKIHEQYTK